MVISLKSLNIFQRGLKTSLIYFANPEGVECEYTSDVQIIGIGQPQGLPL